MIQVKTITVFDQGKNPVLLVDTGKQGGEGAIYCLQQDPSKCAKLYHRKKRNPELSRKIAAMLHSPPKDPTWETKRHHSIAWPDGLLHDEKQEFAGFVMPLLDTKVFRELHKYYDSADRVQRYGGAFTWRHLLAVAYNLASAVGAIHAIGHCVGDLRESNIMVAPNALVTLIDCDSFQVRDKTSGEVFYTRVGTGEYLPPELQGVDFRNTKHDRYYADLFALGVLLFRTLMLGFHPYQGRGKLVDNAPSPEAKIRLGLFPYGNSHPGVLPPVAAPPYDVLPLALRDLLERCFVAGHGRCQERPEAKEWFRVLRSEGSQLTQCGTNENHWYSGHLRDCPWCVLAQTKGKDLFPDLQGLGHQIVVADPTKPLTSASDRSDYLRSYLHMALADGVLTLEEQAYVADLGKKLGLDSALVTRLLQEAVRKTGSRVVGGLPGQGTSTPPSSVSKSDRRFRTGITAAAICAGGSGGALLGMVGRGGGVLVFLATAGVLALLVWEEIRRPGAGRLGSPGVRVRDILMKAGLRRLLLGLGIGTAVMFLFWRLCTGVPVAGGIICGMTSAGTAVYRLSDRLEKYQTSSRYLGGSRSRFNWRGHLIPSVGALGIVLALVAVLSAVIGVALGMLILVAVLGGGYLLVKTIS